MKRHLRTCFSFITAVCIAAFALSAAPAHAQLLLEPPQECVPPGPGLIPSALPFKIDGTPLSSTGYSDWWQGSGGVGTAIFLGCNQASVNPAFFPAIFGRDSLAVSTTTDLDVFSGTSNKNDDFIGSGQSPWAIGTGSVPQKDDMSEVFVNVTTDACFNFWLNGLVAYRSTSGDKHFDVEVNVAGLTRTGTQIIGNGPDNGRTANADFIVTVDYVNGGAAACIEFRVWDGDSYEVVNLPTPPADPISGCDTLMFSAVNQTTISNLPCAVVQESSQLEYDNLYEPLQMAEFAVNLSQLIPGFNPSQYCRDSATVLVKTRSSSSFTAELKDLFLARFNLIQPPPCTVTGPSAICVGGSAQFCETDSPELSHTWSVVSNPPGIASFAPGDSSCKTITFTGAGVCTVKVATTSPDGCESNCFTVVNVSAAPTAAAGPDQNLCQTVPGPTAFTLAGSGSGGTPAWTVQGTTGTASAVIANASSYTSGVNVSGIGTVTLLLTVNGAAECAPATDTVVLTVTERATVGAGPDQNLCQTVPGPTVFTLAGSASGGTPTWTVQGTTGTASAVIANASQLNSNVNVSGIGTVTLRLTVDAASPCPDVFEDVVLTVTERATVAAGPDQSLCATVPGPTVFTLAGSATGGTATWTVFGTTGTASAVIANPNSPTSNVNVSGIGTVTLRLTVDAASPCPDVFEDVVLSVTNQATVSAGPDQNLCQTVPGPTVFALAGSASGGTPTWTVQGTTGTASAVIANPSSPTSNVNVTGIGTVTLRLSVDASEPCPDVFEDVVLTVTERATVAAGPDQSLCATVPGPTVFTLAGSASGGTATWTVFGTTGSASAVIANANQLNTNVNVSGVGTVTLRLTVDAASPCPDIHEDVVLSVTGVATVGAGPDQNLCQTVPGPTVFTLAGSASGGTATWTVFGTTGTASAVIANANQLNSNVNVTGIGTVTLRLSVDAASPCPDVFEDVVLTVTERATVAAGPDQNLCETVPGPTVFTLAGSASGGTATWTVFGTTGTASAVIANANQLNTNVNVSGVGTVTLRLTVDAASPCPDIHEDVVLTVNGKPACTLSAPKSDPLCGSEGNELCVAEVTGATYLWKLISDDAGWQIEGGQGTRCLTYQAGNGGTTAIARVIITTSAGCIDSCQVTLECDSKTTTFCTLTQGGWGNTQGQLGGERRWETVNRLITAGDPLVIGIKKSVNPASYGSISFTDGNEACVFQLMPGGGKARAFVSNLGDVGPTLGNQCSVAPQTLNSQGRFDNVLIGQTVALSLNARLSTALVGVELCEVMVTGAALPGVDNVYGTADDVCTDQDQQTVYISSRVLATLESLGLPKTVNGLIELCNRALSGLPTGTATFSDIAGAAGAINEGFDECRCLLKCSDAGDNAQVSGGGMQDGIALPAEFAVQALIPNPFSHSTMIRLALPERAQVELHVYNVAGQRVGTLQSGEMDAGIHNVQWKATSMTGSSLSAGMYFVRMHAVGVATGTSFSTTRRMVLVR